MKHDRPDNPFLRGLRRKIQKQEIAENERIRLRAGLWYRLMDAAIAFALGVVSTLATQWLAATFLSRLLSA